MEFRCERCGKRTVKPTGHVNRSRAQGLRLFCGRRCAGIAKRQHKTKGQRVEEKRLYDQEYRRKNLALITAKKAAHFRATYDPEKARVQRKKTMARHVEYCRRPEYRRWKSAYDKRYLASKNYGPFAEAAMLANDLKREIKGRATNYDIKQANGTFGKTQQRRRETKEEPERSRPRNRFRRNRHTAPVG